jgi:hypothetical protein
MIGDGTPPRWRKSTFSGPVGDCVEWLAVEHNVYVRDSKQSCGAVLVFTRAEWLVFIARIKSLSGGLVY